MYQYSLIRLLRIIFVKLYDCENFVYSDNLRKIIMYMYIKNLLLQRINMKKYVHKTSQKEIISPANVRFGRQNDQVLVSLTRLVNII